MARSSELEKAYNDGQTDGSNGKLGNLPYEIGPMIMQEFFGSKTIEEMKEVNDAYRQGYDQASSRFFL